MATPGWPERNETVQSFRQFHHVINSDEVFSTHSDSETTRKRNCVAQIIVSLSALASTAVLLAQALPPLLNGFP
jgi:hypothetical protein